MMQNDYDQPQLARKLGISVTTLSQRMNHRTPFTLKESYIIMDLFGLPDERLHEVFPRAERKVTK